MAFVTNYVNQQEADQLEIYRNDTRALISVPRFGPDGSSRFARVGPGALVHLTTQERRHIESSFADPRQNYFRSGALVPVKLPDDIDPEEKDGLFDNPANVTDAELEKILETSQWKAFESKVNKIDSPVVLHRLWARAREENFIGKRRDVIRDRIKAVDPTSVMIGDPVESTEPLVADDGYVINRPNPV